MVRPAAAVQSVLGLLCISLIALAALLLPVATAAQQNPGPTAQNQPRITSAIDESRLTTLRGNTHPLARAEFDRGAAPASLPMQRMLLVLKRGTDQETALDQLLAEQQDAASPNYHKWLTPQQFGQQFGPADQDIQTVTSWLQSHGFQVSAVSNGRTVIEFSGTTRQVQEAFHTEIHQYSVNGESHWANTSDPQIPAALSPVVAGVWTLHNFLKKPQIHVLEDLVQAKLTPGSHGSSPQVTFPGNPALHALGPADFATIYNFNPLYQPSTGFNPRIGVVARSNINLDDVAGFDAYLPLNLLNRASSPAVILNGPDPGNLGGGEEVEAVLDTSWSGALTVNNPASVLLVVSASTSSTDGADLSELYIIDNNFADVMMESFGDCEANFTSAEAVGISSLAQQAAAQGITYTVSAGDGGAEGCDNPDQEQTASGPLSVNVLASTPYTVAVGGTQFNENGNDATYWNSGNAQFTFGSAIKYIPEDVWNQSCSAAQCGQNANILAGGGGSSTLFSKPAWQSGVSGIPSGSARNVPDVSLSAAAHDPYLICLHSSCVPDAQGQIRFFAVFGTSSANASFAGVMALVDLTTNSRQGQANYVMYRLAAAQTMSQCDGSNVSSPPNVATCVFNDITVGNNAVPGEPGFGGSSAKYQSGPGYDLATGLGSLNITNLLSKWGNARSTPSAVTNFTLSPTSGITHGSPVTVNVSVAPKAGTGATPTGDVSLIANIGPTGTGMDAVDHFTLTNGTVAATTTLLPGGSYTVAAHYEGDGTYTASDSNLISVTVAPEASQTQVAIVTFNPNTGQVTSTNASSAAFGSPYTLRVTVSGTSGQGCPVGGTGGVGCPSGSIILKDNGSPLDGAPQGSGSFLLNSQGSAEDQAVQLPAGLHGLAASYPGDNSFGASASNSDQVNITPAATTAMLSASATSVGAGSSVTLTATVATQSNSVAAGIYPTGSVQFMSAGNIIGSVVVTGSANSQTGFAQATATLMTTSLALGQNSITAVYLGDANYSPSSPSTAVTVVVLASTTTAVVSSNSLIAQGSGVTFTATVSTTQNGGPALTGSVQFLSNGSNIGAPVSLSNKQAQFMTASLPQGPDQITAAYSGDTNYAGSTSPAITETVNPGPTFTASANPATINISAPGQMGSTVLTLTSQNGLTGSGGLGAPTCGIAASEEVTCSLTAFTLPSNGSVQPTLTFLTTAPSMTVPMRKNPPTVLPWKTIGMMVAITLLLWSATAARNSEAKRRRWSVALTCTAVALLVISAGCGGGGGAGGGGGGGGNTNPGTPVGNVPLSVTITIGGVTQTVPNLLVTVQ